MPVLPQNSTLLPNGWAIGHDFDGKIYFIDHNTKKTTWVDPRDSYTKAQTFADCVGHELPYGWEECYDHQIGIYYINHNCKENQIEDPRQNWRKVQEEMLTEYLECAQADLDAKQDLVNIKTERLALAKDHYHQLNRTFSNIYSSKSSVSSSGSSSARVDPETLKVDLIEAKSRVGKLKRELCFMKHQVSNTQLGMDALTQVQEKFNNITSGYTLEEARAIITESKSIEELLRVGEKEKNDLLLSLANLGEDVSHFEQEDSGSGTPMEATVSKSSMACQTDFFGEPGHGGAHLAEMTRLKLEYDSAKTAIKSIQHELASMDGQISPLDTESDRDRLMLIREKKQLLMEYKRVYEERFGERESEEIKQKITELETDLHQALHLNSSNLEERLKLQDKRRHLIEKLRETLRKMITLERQLKSISASTLSVSSSSSLGSLSTSSKGSISSLSFTDIYGSDFISSSSAEFLSARSSAQDVAGSRSSLADQNSSVLSLQKRVEKLLKSNTESDRKYAEKLQVLNENVDFCHNNLGNFGLKSQSMLSLSPRSSLSSISPPVDPRELDLDRQIVEICGNPINSVFTLEESEISQILSAQNNVGLSFIPEVIERITPYENLGSGAIPTVERVVARDPENALSAAVSDESVAGDSGVYEACAKGSKTPNCPETPQVQIKLRYKKPEEILLVCIEKARNLQNLIHENCKVCIKVQLFPSPAANFVCCTHLDADNSKPNFGETFSFIVSSRKLATKTVQVNVWCVRDTSLEFPDVSLEFPEEECVGYVQISLADCLLESAETRWYNILNYALIQVPNSNSTVSTLSCGDVSTSTSSNVSILNRGNDFTSNSLSNVSTLNHGEVSTSNNYNLKHSIVNCPLDLTTSNPIDLSTSIQSTTSNANKEESSDDSTIISSQTSTLTRNVAGLEALEENLGDLATLDRQFLPASGPQDSDEESEGSQEDEIFLQDGTLTSEAILENILEQEADDGDDDSENLDNTIQMSDKQTSTECVFSTSGFGLSVCGSKAQQGLPVIKRSKTFSPSVYHTASSYVCRLNRSGSDSCVPQWSRKKCIFERGSTERKSHRWKGRKGTSLKISNNFGHSTGLSGPRTSLDLELDLSAQQLRLQQQRVELTNLRTLKSKAENAKNSPQTSSATEIEACVVPAVISKVYDKSTPVKTSEDRRMQKMLKKTSREMHKLRHSKTPRGEPDLITFKEKIAFFLKRKCTVPSFENCEKAETGQLVSRSSEEEIFQSCEDFTTQLDSSDERIINFSRNVQRLSFCSTASDSSPLLDLNLNKNVQSSSAYSKINDSFNLSSNLNLKSNELNSTKSVQFSPIYSSNVTVTHNNNSSYQVNEKQVVRCNSYDSQNPKHRLSITLCDDNFDIKQNNNFQNEREISEKPTVTDKELSVTDNLLINKEVRKNSTENNRELPLYSTPISVKQRKPDNFNDNCSNIDNNSAIDVDNMLNNRDNFVGNVTVNDNSIDNRTIIDYSIDNRIINNNPIAERTINNFIVNKTINDNSIANKTINDNSIANRTINNSIVNRNIYDNSIANNTTNDKCFVNRTIVDNLIVDSTRRIENLCNYNAQLCFPYSNSNVSGAQMYSPYSNTNVPYNLALNPDGNNQSHYLESKYELSRESSRYLNSTPENLESTFSKDLFKGSNKGPDERRNFSTNGKLEVQTESFLTKNGGSGTLLVKDDSLGALLAKDKDLEASQSLLVNDGFSGNSFQRVLAKGKDANAGGTNKVFHPSVLLDPSEQGVEV